MRITGGVSKGRQLSALRGHKIRPSSERVREAIFNIIGQDLADINVLDLFAGSGILGIEALSRGAAGSLFIDRSQQSVGLIRKNLTLCGFEKSGAVLKRDLSRGLPWKHEMMRRKFGLVFIDPPYGKKMITPILDDLWGKNFLDTPAIVVAESSKCDTLPETFGAIHLALMRIYGETKLTVYHYGVEQ
ncbi:MAG: 16S rRNA (guanine(966)-N(2))-methyltransferase RsmD [Deltaproteobacteria bacterium]|nr:16S rRNA (guanine(966)-N(2))-methyltransferase RsmD [Deltaproteobacteria bacterium]